MKVLIIGNGGREHAITWKVAQSPLVKNIWVAPGNPGTLSEPKAQNVLIQANEVEKLVKFAQSMSVDLTIVGPETALAAGIADAFEKEDLAIFAPTQAAAQLEISKDFSKQFMQSHNIPTAAYQTFTDMQKAHHYLEKQLLPIVIKADGLAAGKGVVIAEDLATAKATVSDMLSGQAFGEAGARVVIEAFLSGQEMSYIVMSDGENIIPLASSQDHKRLNNANKGPNTGGMGAISPSPLLTPKLEQQILEKIITPTIQGMRDAGTPYKGFLYAGLMIDAQQQPQVLEFNCRLGDPETQAILPRLQSDFAKLCLMGASKKLKKMQTEWSSNAAITIVMAASGYPTKYHQGDQIHGLTRCPSNIKVFQAGTKQTAEGLVTAGGRVLSVTALGETLQLAYETAYNGVECINWKDCHYRTDIGLLCMTPPTST
jgi:phosphoribosylamine--glycine ligase